MPKAFFVLNAAARAGHGKGKPTLQGKGVVAVTLPRLACLLFARQEILVRAHRRRFDLLNIVCGR